MGESRSRRAKGDPLREAFQQHYVGLVRLGTLLTGHQGEAEDLVQEAFVRAAAALERLPMDDVRPYLRRTVMNLWSNRLRRLRLERQHLLHGELSSDISFEERDELWEAVKRLAPRQRACVVLRYYEELSEPETAKLLRCTVGTVKSQTHKALDHMRRELGDGS